MAETVRRGGVGAEPFFRPPDLRPRISLTCWRLKSVSGGRTLLPAGGVGPKKKDIHKLYYHWTYTKTLYDI
jgi:hypothetical protein